MASTIPGACRVLGLAAAPRSQKELKKAFLAMARKYHPDTCATAGATASGGNAKGAQEAARKMSEVNAAYKTLKDCFNNADGTAGGGLGAVSHAAGGTLSPEVGAFTAETTAGVGVPLPWQRAGGGGAGSSGQQWNVPPRDARAARMASKAAPGTGGGDSPFAGGGHLPLVVARAAARQLVASARSAAATAAARARAWPLRTWRALKYVVSGQ